MPTYNTKIKLILNIYSDASYIGASNACSNRVKITFWDNIPKTKSLKVNDAIHILIISIATLAVDVKLGALLINAKEVHII